MHREETKCYIDGELSIEANGMQEKASQEASQYISVSLHMGETTQ